MRCCFLSLTFLLLLPLAISLRSAPLEQPKERYQNLRRPIARFGVFDTSNDGKLQLNNGFGPHSPDGKE